MPGGLYLNTPDNSPGLFVGATPDWQIKQQQIAQTDAFSKGLPTDANGNIDYNAAAKTLLQKGAFEPAKELLGVGIQQQAIRAGLDSANRLEQGFQPAAPASAPGGGGAGFDSAVKQTLGFEGGLNPKDTNGTPSNYGINQKANPGVDVASLTPDAAKSIYKSKYWDAIGGDSLSPQMQGMVFDSAVMMGPERAKTLLAQSGGDPQKFMDLREGFLGDLLTKDPDKYGKYASAWSSRNAALRQSIGNAIPSAGVAAASPADVSSPPARVADNGTSDGAPSSTHPYAPTAPASQAPSALAAQAPAAGLPAPVQVAGPGAPSAPAAPAPIASQNAPSAVDPTLGGLLKGQFVGNPGGYITALRAQAVRLATLGNAPGAAAYNQQATMVENALTRSETPEIKNYAVALRQGYQGTMMDFARDGAAQVESAKLAAQGDPAVIRAKGQAAEATAAGTEQGKTPYELVPMQPVPGGPTVMVPKSQVLAANAPMVEKQPAVIGQQQLALGKTISSIPDQLRQRQVTRERVDAMSNLLETFQTGAAADQKAAAVAAVRAAGINIPDSATANPTAVEQFAKNAQANVFSQIKDQGGKVLVSEIQGFQKANANSNMQPESNAAILAQQKGLLDWQDAHDQAMLDWYHKNPYSFDSSQFETQWEKSNPPKDFVAAARKEIAPRGVAVPAPTSRVVGQRYNIPGKGVYRWMGQGWAQ